MDLSMDNILLRLQSYDALANVLSEQGYRLSDFQVVDALKAVYFKHGVARWDTGMGKTVWVCAVAKMLINEVPSRKFVMIIDKSQIDQMQEDLLKFGGFESVSISGTYEDLQSKMLSGKFLRAPFVILTKEAIASEPVLRAVYPYLKLFCGIFVDEVHAKVNFTESMQAYVLRALLRRFEYRFGMTATPITSQRDQLANLMHLLHPESFKSLSDLHGLMNEGNNMMERFPEFFFHRTREVDLGQLAEHNTIPVYIEPTEEQEGKRGMHLSMITKGKGAVPQATKVADICVDNINNGQRGLIYVNYHAVREWLLPFLDARGIKYATVNGKTPRDERTAIRHAFAKGEIDIVITSITKALNFDSDFVIFYEFCTDIKQMIGRAHRGLNPKVLDIYFIFTLRTGEIDSFIKNTYERSLDIQELVGSRYSEIVTVGEDVAKRR